MVTDAYVTRGVPDALMIIDGYVAGDDELRWRMMRDWYAKRDELAHFNTILILRTMFSAIRTTVTAPHLWAYELDKLVFLCAEAGFRRVDPWPHDPEIGNPDRAWGSVHTVAYK
jgi:hypothetical protein